MSFRKLEVQPSERNVEPLRSFLVLRFELYKGSNGVQCFFTAFHWSATGSAAFWRLLYCFLKLKIKSWCPPLHADWKVRWSFIVHKTFLELHRKTAAVFRQGRQKDGQTGGSARGFRQRAANWGSVVVCWFSASEGTLISASPAI